MVATTKPNKESPLHLRCDWKRCMKEAQVFPIIVVPSPRWSRDKKAKIEMEMDLNICPDHAIEDIDVFMDDNGWKQMTQGFDARKMALPDRDKVYVIFRAIEDRQVQP